MDDSNVEPSMLDWMRVREVRDGVWEALSKPYRVPRMPLAYGGGVLGTCVAAAFASLGKEGEDRALHSLMARYLMACRADMPLQMRVSGVRQTRNYTTVEVVAFQLDKEGIDRDRIRASLDFVLVPPGGSEALFSYSVKPRSRSLDPSHAKAPAEMYASLKGRPGIPNKVSDAMSSPEGSTWHQLRDVRYPSDDITHQVLWGAAPHAPTNQDDRAMTDVLASEWTRLRPRDEERRLQINKEGHCAPISKRAMNAVVTVWALDPKHADLPVYASHMSFEDIQVWATLELVIRWLADDMDYLKEWHLVETTTNVGGAGRVLGEARVFNRAGVMQASGTSACVVQAKKAKL